MELRPRTGLLSPDFKAYAVGHKGKKREESVDPESFYSGFLQGNFLHVDIKGSRSVVFGGIEWNKVHIVADKIAFKIITNLNFLWLLFQFFSWGIKSNCTLYNVFY